MLQGFIEILKNVWNDRATGCILKQGINFAFCLLPSGDNGNRKSVRGFYFEIKYLKSSTLADY